MTVIIKYPVNPYWNSPLPEEVNNWINNNPECEELENQFHSGYRIIIFRDDWSATAFKLKFLDKLSK